MFEKIIQEIYASPTFLRAVKDEKCYCRGYFEILKKQINYLWNSKTFGENKTLIRQKLSVDSKIKVFECLKNEKMSRGCFCGFEIEEKSIKNY